MKRNGILNWIGVLFVLLIFNTCQSKDEVLDIEPPTVSILSPAPNSEIWEDSIITIRLDAYDKVGIEKVELLLDGNLLTTFSAPPYETTWDTHSKLGMHTIKANAYDVSNNRGESKIPSFKVIGFPSAGFIASENTISLGDTVTFTDQTTNSPYSWLWDFGDGGTSTVQNPSHAYWYEGTYTVTLTATNNYGSDIETKTNFIIVTPFPPIAAFTVNQTTIIAHNTLFFTDQSTNTPTIWSWDFGDGGTSTDQYPSHTYSTEGTYTVSLTVTNSYGSDTEIKSNYITVFSDAIIFNPNLTYGSVTDIDGNTYKTLQIGTQTWMAENLKTTKYNDGSDIPLVTNNNTWEYLSTPGYCWYNNDIANKGNYGALYNWYTVNTEKLAPTGWHVPTDAEWSILAIFLGGENIAGGKLKETGFTHWYEPNEGATNESGFTALPGGTRNLSNGAFSDAGDNGYWWSSNEYGINYAYYRGLGYGYADVYRNGSNKRYGFSVRCVRD